MNIYTYNFNKNLSKVLGLEPNCIPELSDQTIKELVDESPRVEWGFSEPWNKGMKGEYTLSEEHKKKISNSLKGIFVGKHVTEETRKKMSESGKIKVFTQEHKKNLSEGHKGIAHTTETKNKISNAIRGIKRSEETRKKMSRPKRRCNCIKCGREISINMLMKHYNTHI